MVRTLTPSRPTLGRIGLAAFALSVILAFEAPGAAQAQTDTQEPAEQQIGQVSQDEVQSFVEAAQAIQQINADLRSQLQGVESQAKQAAHTEEARERMIGAVEGAGLTLERYNNIYRAMDANPDLEQRIMQEMEGG